MTKKSIECCDMIFYFQDHRNIVISVRYNEHSQGILTIDKYDVDPPMYNIYKWFDEGGFPDDFDTIVIDGDRRLKIVGVDEL